MCRADEIDDAEGERCSHGSGKDGSEECNFPENPGQEPYQYGLAGGVIGIRFSVYGSIRANAMLHHFPGKKPEAAFELDELPGEIYRAKKGQPHQKHEQDIFPDVLFFDHKNSIMLNYPFDVGAFTFFFLKDKDDRNIKKRLIFFNFKN
jgi:hypothetical protein